MHPATDQDWEKLREMIRDMNFAMLTTVDADGTLRSRPMALNREAGFDGDLWFFTYASSHKVEEIESNPHVNVSFSSTEKQRYVSLTGRAQLVRDRARIEELWSPALKAWFPKCTDEPDIALLRVTVEHAEYWDAPSSVVAHAISFVKTIATGEPARPGDHASVDLNRAA